MNRGTAAAADAGSSNAAQRSNGPSAVFVVSEMCPVGCGPVVLLLVRATGSLIAYCDSCGCTWLDPAEAHFERGLDEAIGLSDRAPAGVDLPARDDVVRHGVADSIIATISIDEWGTTADELNAAIERVLADRGARPG